jgi:WD40 repeat protein/class 3 adenylate cyclase
MPLAQERPMRHDEAAGRRASSDVRTFLIADIRGYTPFTEERGDEAAARLATRFAEIVGDVVAARGGSLTELRGDEALAVFVSPRAALRAAVEAQAAFSEETVADPSLPLRVGIGLDAGEAVAAAGGLRGGALNLAARLCGRAAAGEVLASAAVIHLARRVDGLTYRELGSESLKGLDEPVAIYAVEGLTPVPALEPHATATQVPPDLAAPAEPLVGRDDEVRWLRGNWRLAARGSPRVLVVSGPPGIGKTRLAAELACHVADLGGTVRYVPASADQATFERALPVTDQDGSGLIVLDDLDAADAAAITALARALPLAGPDRRLVLLLVRSDIARSAVRELVDRVAPSDGDRRELGALGAEAVRSIAEAYRPGAGDDVPVATMLEASGGVPDVLHEVVAEWARADASLRLEASVDRAASDRLQARHLGSRLTDDIIAMQAIQERTRRIAGLEARATPDGRAMVCPFKGLAAFESSDAEYYFGRERLVAELVGRLVGATFVGIVGPSGSGKSSLLRAGVLHSLASGVLPGSEHWPQVLVRPSTWSAEALAGAIGPVARAALPAGQRLVVAIDQFEEVFTAVEGESERAAFIEVLTEAAHDPDGRAVVVLAIRADFYGRCAAYPDLSGLLASNHQLVGVMTPAEIRRAIELPAERTGLLVEPDLVDALVADVIDQPGSLPLLSTALLELWQRRDGRVMLLSAYAATDGVTGAVARLAEDAYGRLEPSAQATARAILLRLADEGATGTVVRRRAALAEFAGDLDETNVIDVLVASRLLTVDEGNVEVAHEAVLREWPRLRDWLAEDAEGRRLRHQLGLAAAAWDEGGRDPDELWRGARLTSALDLVADDPRELGELAASFLAESRAASERDTDRQRRTNRRLRIFLAAALGALAIAVGLGAFAALQRAEAERVARLASARELASSAVANLEVDPDLSLLLAAEAVRMTRSDDGTVTREAEEALRGAIAGHRLVHRWEIRGVGGLAFLPDAAGLVVSNASPNAARVLDLASGSVGDAEFAHHALVRGVAVSPDGREILTAGQDGVVSRWEVESGAKLATYGQLFSGSIEFFAVDPSWSRVASRHETDDFIFDTVVHDLASGEARSFGRTQLGEVALDRGGRRLAVADGSVVVWDVEERTRLATFGPGEFYGVTFAPDGESLAATSLDGTATVWDLDTERVLVRLPGHAGWVVDVGYAPDGKTIVTAGADGTVRTWDPLTGAPRLTLRGRIGEVYGVTVDADSRLVAAFGSAGVAVWDISSAAGQEFAEMDANGDHVAYSPDGSRLFVGGTDGVVREFDAATGRLTGEHRAHDGYIYGIAMSPDGRLGTVAEDGRVRLWDTASMEPVGEALGIPGSPIGGIAFGPTGNQLATASDDGLGRIWDVASGTVRTLVGHAGTIDGVAYSPDGTTVATAGYDGTVRLWDAASGRQTSALIDPGAGVYWDLAFSPDGTRLAASNADGRGRIWRISDGTAGARPDVTLVGHSADVEGIVFDPSGSTVATASRDGTVRLWDAESGRERLIVTRVDYPVFGVAISRDGSRLAVGAAASTRQFTLDIGELVAFARARATRGLTDDECQRYLRVPACPTAAP